MRNNIVVGLSDAVPVIIDRTAPVVTLTRLNATAGERPGRTAGAGERSVADHRVEFFRGNTLIGQSTAFPFSFNYTLQPGDTPSVDFSAQARDAGGNLGTSNVISFGTLAPTVSLARSPTTGTITSSQTLTFTATAASNNGNGINRVEFFKGAAKLGEDSTAPYQQDYTVTGADEPALTVMAKAIDNVPPRSQAPDRPRRARSALARRDHVDLRLITLPQDQLRVAIKHAACFSRRHTTLGPHEQLLAHFAFKSRELLAEGGLSDVENVGRLGQAADVDDLDEVAEPPKIHEVGRHP